MHLLLKPEYAISSHKHTRNTPPRRVNLIFAIIRSLKMEPKEKTISGPRAVEKKVVRELKELRDSPLPKPAEDWDLIWVLSGLEITLEEHDAKGKNETRDRIWTGFELVRAVTAKRLGKSLHNVTIEDIRAYGPKLYFNGREEHNENLRNIGSDGVLEKKYNFPRENLEIAPGGLNITNTGDQFERFPPELLENKRKIVIVSSARHLPRVRRYTGLETNPFSDMAQDRLVFYQAMPVEFPFRDTIREVRVIPKYQAAGFLPPEKT